MIEEPGDDFDAWLSTFCELGNLGCFITRLRFFSGSSAVCRRSSTLLSSFHVQGTVSGFWAEGGVGAGRCTDRSTRCAAGGGTVFRSTRSTGFTTSVIALGGWYSRSGSEARLLGGGSCADLTFELMTGAGHALTFEAVCKTLGKGGRLSESGDEGGTGEFLNRRSGSSSGRTGARLCWLGEGVQSIGSSS